jgi:predicted NBD/HSP70 family sugar kinase
MALRRRSDVTPITGPATASAFITILTEGPLPRGEVARRADVPQSALAKTIKPLLDAGYLTESVDRAGHPIRPTAALRVRADRAFFAGVKITGSSIVGALVDLRAEVQVTRRRTLIPRDVDTVVTAVGEVVAELLATEELRARVKLVGVTVSGDVEREVGLVRYAPFLGWHDVPLAELLEAKLGLPTIVENDVRALTMAEQWFGAGVGVSSFALIAVGQGVGCGMAVNGTVIAGAHGVAGEVGHLPIDPDGPMCHCGNRGCIEAVAADPAIVHQINDLPDVEVGTPAEAAALARAGHPGARAVYARAGHAIGLGVAAVVNLFGPELVIISGEALHAYDLYEMHIRSTFGEHVFSTAARCEVVAHPLPFEAWARGAAAAAIQTFITPQKP